MASQHGLISRRPTCAAGRTVSCKHETIATNPSSSSKLVRCSRRAAFDAKSEHTPKGQANLALSSSSRGCRGPWSENDTLGQERRKRHQNSTRNATPKRQTLFALTSSWSSASPRPKVPSASALQDIRLTLNFLSVSASRLGPACDQQVLCPYSRRNRPRAGLRIFGVPCHTSHPTLETARPPLQAKPAPSASLA